MEELKKKKAAFAFYSKIRKNPRIKYRELHSQSPYKTEYVTTQFAKKLFENLVLVGPYLYCNSGISVELFEDLDKNLTFLEERKEDENVTHAVALMGDYAAIVFSKGASILDFAEHIPPSLNGKGPENVYFETGQRLGSDPYPHGWSETDWIVYNAMRKPRARYFWKVGRKIGLSTQAVRDHYSSILEDCKVHLSLFPNGYYGYSQLFLTFKTKYETGLKAELQKLDRTSYLFRCKDLIILVLFVDSNIYGGPCRKFKEMEEKGIISDLKASIPIEFYSALDRF
jgi:hypothetical protein